MITKIPTRFNYKKKFKIFNFKGKRGTIRKPIIKEDINYAVVAKQNCVINSKQIEVIRQRLAKPLKKIKKKKVKLNMKIYPTWSKTKKPLQVRMGKGKGNPYIWVTNVKKGKVLFTIEGPVRLNIVREACSRLLYKTSTYLKLCRPKKLVEGKANQVFMQAGIQNRRQIKR